MTRPNAIPDNLAKYSETPVFTEATVPQKLTSIHDTKAGTWGKLCVLKGQIRYIIPGSPQHAETVHAGNHAIIIPAEKHYVEIIGPVEFKVEFYRLPRP